MLATYLASTLAAALLAYGTPGRLNYSVLRVCCDFTCPWAFAQAIPSSCNAFRPLDLIHQIQLLYIYYGLDISFLKFFIILPGKHNASCRIPASPSSITRHRILYCTKVLLLLHPNLLSQRTCLMYLCIPCI